MSSPIQRPWRIISITGLAALIFLLTAACTQNESSGAAPARPAAATGIPHLVDLGAEQCIPCKMMKPILDELREEYAGRMDVTFIDVRKYREEAEVYRVRMIPTQIFYDAEGNELYRRSGFIGKDDILATWRKLGYEF
jgi:thioredoxin 1